jgi:hypothetical protein
MGSVYDDLKRLADDMKRMNDKMDEHRTEVKAWRQEDLAQTSSLATTVDPHHQDPGSRRPRRQAGGYCAAAGPRRRGLFGVAARDDASAKSLCATKSGSAAAQPIWGRPA